MFERAHGKKSPEFALVKKIRKFLVWIPKDENLSSRILDFENFNPGIFENYDWT